MLREYWKEEFLLWYACEHAKLTRLAEYVHPLLKILVAEVVEDYVEISWRIKTAESTLYKFERKYMERATAGELEEGIRDYVTDFLGFRVVVYFDDEVEQVVALFKDKFGLIGKANKSAELESEVSSFGYRAYHVDVTMKEESSLPEVAKRFASQQFEVQIRTVVQDPWSRLSHKLSYKKQVPHGAARKLSMLAAQFEQAESVYMNVRDMVTSKAGVSVVGELAANSVASEIVDITRIDTLDEGEVSTLIVRYEKATAKNQEDLIADLRSGWKRCETINWTKVGVVSDSFRVLVGLYAADRMKNGRLLTLEHRKVVDRLLG